MHDQILERFFTKLSKYSKEDAEKIKRAALFADERHGDQKRASGEPYIIHPIAVAETLISLDMDADTVCAGLMHDVLEDTETTHEEIAELFGETCANLIEGVTKIAAIKLENKSLQEAETIRKMFFAMSEDIRVIIIKLADKRHNMSTLQFLRPARAREIASECLDIYAPLADRLGISWLKDELEDLSLKMLKPETYQSIEEYMSTRRKEQEDYLDRIEKDLYRAIAAAGISDVRIISRAKHIYSIYMKMKRRGKDIGEIFDILGVRIICADTTTCYTILGIVHQLWPPIEGRFKDYIAMPKANNYRSLHTTVMAKDGRLLEIQIRTKEMDYTAEYGVAAHWTYKAESGREATDWKNLDSEHFSRILSKLKDWTTEIEQSESFMDDIKSDILKDTIIVFTPKGKSVELPANATALDFAYMIHTEVGNRCVGAKANGSIIPLSQPLQNTQVVEILTNPNAKPRVNWLKYAHTTSARRKIRAWLNKNSEDVVIEKNIIAKRHVPDEDEELKDEDIKLSVDRRASRNASQSLLGMKNMMISFAHCCNPVRGDEIVGYISRGRGIIVHRKDCPNLKHMTEIEERKVDVSWEGDTWLLRRFHITSKRTSDIFGEIEGVIKRYGGNLIEGHVEEDDGGKLFGTFAMECANEESFKKTVKAIRELKNVQSITPAT